MNNPHRDPVLLYQPQAGTGRYYSRLHAGLIVVALSLLVSERVSETHITRHTLSIASFNKKHFAFPLPNRTPIQDSETPTFRHVTGFDPLAEKDFLQPMPP